jgi:cyclic pyranopterin monophosphate synthase
LGGGVDAVKWTVIAAFVSADIALVGPPPPQDATSCGPAPGCLPCKIELRMVKKLSHYDGAGRARMVDVSAKAPTRRAAEASAFVAMTSAVLAALPQNPKGNPLEVARIAGIMAAKRTSELIPMCHPLPLALVDVDVTLCENGVTITSKVATTAETGVEMEALVAASVAALTLYDMCKALDKGIEIREIVLQRKSGGKSGDYRRSKKSLLST